jgi:hypothetical protein
VRKANLTARIATGPPPRLPSVWPVRGSSPGSGITRLAFPTCVSGLRVRELLPLQWRGRTGIPPVSVAPARHMNCRKEPTSLSCDVQLSA